MPDDMDYLHACIHCNQSIRRSGHGSAYVDHHGRTYGNESPRDSGAHGHLHEPPPMTGRIHDYSNWAYLQEHLSHDHDETPAGRHAENVDIHTQEHSTGAYDAEQDMGMHGTEHEPMGGARGAQPEHTYNHPTDNDHAHVPYSRDNDRRALEYADMSDPDTHEHHYDEAGGNAPSHNDTVVHEHPTGHAIHVVPPGRPGGRHEVRIDSPDGESEYPERFDKDIALDRPDEMPKSLHPHIHKAFDQAEAMDKEPRNAAPHDDEVPHPGEGLDDYLKRMRERDNKVHENLPANHPSREGGDNDLHEYGNESALRGHLADPTPHGHGHADHETLDGLLSHPEGGRILRDMHRREHEGTPVYADMDHTHDHPLERRTQRSSPLRSDDGSHYTSDGQTEYFENSWGHGSTGTGHRHRVPSQYEHPTTPQRRVELLTHLSQHHGYDTPGDMPINEAAQMHVSHHGGDLGEIGGGRHNGGVSPNHDYERMHNWRVQHLSDEHGIYRSHHMSDEGLNDLHERAHEDGVMNTDHEHRDEGHHAMKTIAMNAQDETGEHYARVNLPFAEAREAGLALLRQARVQIEAATRPTWVVTDHEGEIASSKQFEAREEAEAEAARLRAEQTKQWADPRDNFLPPFRVRQASLTKEAHDSGDGETIYHCPFCGSGQVVARSDRTIECDFCHTCFTVQVQPEFSAFPQTIDGAPVDVPGMPGQIQQNDPNAVSDGPVDPSQLGDDGSDPAAFAGPPGPNNQPPWLKGAYRTESGAVLDEDAFIRHVALKASENDPGVLVQVRAENLH